MCTVLITPRLQGGYLLGANRDEVHCRPRALPPTCSVEEGVTVLAPTDPLGGGTWIAVNSHGLGITLLNGYDADVKIPAEPPLSRGLVVKSLASSQSLEELLQRVETAIVPELDRLYGFVLLAVASGDGEAPEALRLSWDQVELKQEAIALPHLEISSSYETQAVRRERARALAPLLAHYPGSLEELRGPFSAHLPERGPFSVCMHRDDAATVSHTGIEVSSETIEMQYIDGSPCTLNIPDGPDVQAIVISRREVEESL